MAVCCENVPRVSLQSLGSHGQKLAAVRVSGPVRCSVKSEVVEKSYDSPYLMTEDSPCYLLLTDFYDRMMMDSPEIKEVRNSLQFSDLGSWADRHGRAASLSEVIKSNYRSSFRQQYKLDLPKRVRWAVVEPLVMVELTTLLEEYDAVGGKSSISIRAIIDSIIFRITRGLLTRNGSSFTRNGAGRTGGSGSRDAGDRGGVNRGSTDDVDLELGDIGNGGLQGSGGRQPGDGGDEGDRGHQGRIDNLVLKAYWVGLLAFIVSAVLALLNLLAAFQALGPNNFREILNADSLVVVAAVIYLSAIVTWITWLAGGFH